MQLYLLLLLQSTFFKLKSSVEAALSMDRTKLEGRPMFISPSVDKSRNPTQFKVEYY